MNEIARKVMSLIAGGYYTLDEAFDRVAKLNNLSREAVESRFQGYVVNAWCMKGEPDAWGDEEESGEEKADDSADCQAIDLADYVESSSFDTWGEYQQELVDMYRNEY